MKMTVLTLATALCATTVSAKETPLMSVYGADMCVEYDVGHMWLSATHEKRTTFTENHVTKTVWLREGSADPLITYPAYIKVFGGRIVYMMCQTST
jgi:hypothetical protein